MNAINEQTRDWKLSDETIAALAGKPGAIRSVKRARKRLRDAGWIGWKRTSDANVYFLRHENTWAAMDEIMQGRMRKPAWLGMSHMTRAATLPNPMMESGSASLEVRDYLDAYGDPKHVDAELRQARIETYGPRGNFGAVLFIEKEGFSPLLRAARIAEKYDLAIMSTKGMSVVAARTLVDEMCFTHDIPLLILHDFDKAGFSIAGTLQRDTRRYEFQNEIDVIDLGLTLRDVEAMGLESEYQVHTKGKKRLLMDNLRENGATNEEIAFMFQDFDKTRSTRRVELNAMTSPQFIAFLERKLKEHGIAKVVPDKDELEKSCKFFVRNLAIEKIVRRELKGRKFDDDAIKVPNNLAGKVKKLLSRHPELRWDSALYQVAGGKLEKSEPKPKAKQEPKPQRSEPPPDIKRALDAVMGEGWCDPTKPGDSLKAHYDRLCKAGEMARDFQALLDEAKARKAKER